MPDLTVDPLDTVDNATLCRWEQRAWREAVRSWQEYHALPSWGRPGYDAEVSRIMRDAALSDEAHWEHLHDRRVQRGLSNTYPVE